MPKDLDFIIPATTYSLIEQLATDHLLHADHYTVLSGYHSSAVMNVITTSFTYRHINLWTETRHTNLQSAFRNTNAVDFSLLILVTSPYISKILPNKPSVRFTTSIVPTSGMFFRNNFIPINYKNCINILSTNVQITSAKGKGPVLPAQRGPSKFESLTA